MAHNRSSKQRHALRVRRIAVKLRRTPIYILDLAVLVADQCERADIAIKAINMVNRTSAFEASRNPKLPRYARGLASTSYYG